MKPSICRFISLIDHFPSTLCTTTKKPFADNTFPIISARNTGKYCDFPVYLWEILQDFPVYLWEKWKANRFLVELNEGGDISITIDFAPLLPPFSLKMTHCSHEFNALKDLEETIFGKFKAKCETVSYNGHPGGMSKRILWTKFDPDFLCYFPAAQQKGHNSEMWNRNFERSIFHETNFLKDDEQDSIWNTLLIGG